MLSCRNVVKSYSGKVALNNISLSVPNGSLMSVIGPNGAGKSTLLGILSRLTACDSGAVELDDKNILQWKRGELSKTLAVMTQRKSFQSHITVHDFVSFARFPYSRNHLTADDRAAIDSAMEQAGVQTLRSAYIDELSGGQQQLAHIALVLAQETDYILLDEPTANLDIAHSLRVMRLLRRLCDEQGKTIVLALHELPYAAFFSDYVCAIRNGRIEQCGAPRQVMTQEMLSQLYGVEFELVAQSDKAIPFARL